MTSNPYPATMADVAEKSGYSKMTVSRAFSGTGTISEKAKKKIFSIAKEIGYEFNALASQLSSNKSGYIGIATFYKTMLGSSYFQEIILGIQSEIKKTKLPYEIALFDTSESNCDNGDKLAKLYHQRLVDGLIVIAPNANDQFLSSFQDEGIPLVLVGSQLHKSNISSVTCDNYTGIQNLTQKLVDLGHTKFGYLGKNTSVYDMSTRYQAFLDTLIVNQLKITQDYIEDFQESPHKRKEGIQRLLGKGVTALVCVTDDLAKEVLSIAKSQNIKVPEQLVVTGFDNTPESVTLSPSLTTVEQPIQEIGKEAISQLNQLIEGGAPQQTQLKTIPHFRESTGTK